LLSQPIDQLDTIVFETYDDNRNGWDVSTGVSSSLKIRNGVYEISRHSGSGLIVSLQRFVEEKKDFIIQCDFNPGKINDEKGFGLVWGHSPETLQDNYFLIFPDNSFIIQTDQKGRKDLGVRIQVPKLEIAGKFTLKIAQNDGILFFYCNDRLIKSTPRLDFFGMDVGLITFQTGSFSADNLLLLSDTHIQLPHKLAAIPAKENLDPVNSRYSEIHPIISADARTLYFARKNSPENVGGMSDKQDIWFSTSDDGVQWSKGKNLGNGVNTTRADNLTAVSPDNNSMMFYHPRENGAGGFRFRRRTSLGWVSDEIVDLEFDNESAYVESCLSAGGNIILFTAKTKSNVAYQPAIDERDIYMCMRVKNKEWSKPVNLGRHVNSPGDEFSPFLAADERTLYFGTNGRPGYGRVDIFMTKRLDDSWKKWSTPVNLGPSINSPLFDAYYTIPASGDYAYMVSFQEGSGDTDLVRVKLPRELKPDPVQLLRTVVQDRQTHKPVSADITVLADDEPVLKTFSSQRTGESSVVLKVRKKYVVTVNARGYLPESDTIDVGVLTRFTELKKVIALTPLITGAIIPVNRIYFDQGKSSLLHSSFAELDKLAMLMYDNPSMDIKVEGHTDNVGIVNDLQALSEARAREVKRYLMKKGIASARIEIRGYGASRPVVKNESEAQRQQNRRVEVKIIRP
jgi:outer membrane protein OmpA-like peptidoglycan-associated protein